VTDIRTAQRAAKNRLAEQARWVPVVQVHKGDRVVVLLADAGAAVEITGWTDRRLDLTRHGLPIAYQRTYTVKGAPWFVTERDLRHDVNGLVLIIPANSPERPGT
jgi:hypothetical protein